MHLTPLDIFLFGLVVFAAWRMFNSRKQDRRPPDQRDQTGRPGQSRRSPGPSDSAGPADEDDEEARRRQASEAYRRAQSAWDHLRGDSRPQASPVPGPDPAAGPAAPPAPGQPGQEDEAAFLAGAKAMYARVRESWGDRDLDDLAQFLTERCLADFTARAGTETPGGRTDVMLVEAVLLAMAPGTATVRYTALIREANVGDAPHQVREDWTFTRPADQPDAMWKLDAVAEPAV